MNIKDLTLGQLEELKTYFNTTTTNNGGGFYDKFKGKYVIVRTRNEGVNAGEVLECDETGVVLKDARRLWYHNAREAQAWYEGVSQVGITADSKLSAPTIKVIVEDYSLTLCTPEAEKSLREHPSHVQS